MARRKKIKKKDKPLIIAAAVIAVVLITADKLLPEKIRREMFSFAGLGGGGFAVTENDALWEQSGGVFVHYIDVGQGDCELIQAGGLNILIDGGEADKAGRVIQYLGGLNVTRLNYVIVTHPHSDHMGAVAAIITAIKTDEVLLPNIPQDMTATTVTFAKLLKTVKEKEVTLDYAKPGGSIKLGGSASLEFYAPVEDKEYDNLNNFSIVCKLVDGEIKFLFTGDAERQAESDILESGADIGADVLKVGHQGSETSTAENFLSAVNPSYAVIEVGAGNTYDHPRAETLNRLEQHDCKVYRTDLNGNIVFKTDGKQIAIKSER